MVEVRQKKMEKALIAEVLKKIGQLRLGQLKRFSSFQIIFCADLSCYLCTVYCIKCDLSLLLCALEKCTTEV